MEKIKLVSPCCNEGNIYTLLNKRRSVREYKNIEITLKEVSNLLWGLCGKNSDWGGRTTPSAGATYPLEIYFMSLNVESLQKGIYHYQVDAHSISLVKEGDFSQQLTTACLNQKMLKNAPLTIIISADFSRTSTRYGERGLRYVYMEAGHCGQNLHIVSELLGLGTVMMGAFKDEEVKKVLGINEEVLYLCPVGRK